MPIFGTFPLIWLCHTFGVEPGSTQLWYGSGGGGLGSLESGIDPWLGLSATVCNASGYFTNSTCTSAKKEREQKGRFREVALTCSLVQDYTSVHVLLPLLMV